MLNHKVDELLVGIVKQIRLTPARERKRRNDASRGDVTCVRSAKGLLDKLLKRHSFVSRSCDNLLVL